MAFRPDLGLPAVPFFGVVIPKVSFLGSESALSVLWGAGGMGRLESWVIRHAFDFVDGHNNLMGEYSEAVPSLSLQVFVWFE